MNALHDTEGVPQPGASLTGSTISLSPVSDDSGEPEVSLASFLEHPAAKPINAKVKAKVFMVRSEGSRV
jgi:hypothetical protein